MAPDCGPRRSAARAATFPDGGSAGGLTIIEAQNDAEMRAVGSGRWRGADRTAASAELRQFSGCDEGVLQAARAFLFMGPKRGPLPYY